MSFFEVLVLIGLGFVIGGFFELIKQSHEANQHLREMLYYLKGGSKY